MATITHGGTLPDSSAKADFYALIDTATIATIVNADVSNTAALAISKLATTGDLTISNIDLASSRTTTNSFAVTSNSLTTGGIGYFYSNGTDTSSRNLLSVINDNTAATGAVCLNIQQDAVAYGLSLDQNGNSNALYADIENTTAQGIQILCDVLTTGSCIYLSSNSAETSGRYLLQIVQQNASATGAIPIKLAQASSASQILGQGNENLSNAGVWTDRTCTYADKENISPLEIKGFVDKLKNLKLFNYQKKCEIYGNKIDNKDKKTKEYPKEVKNSNARFYKGFILDDPSTPEELISRDNKGEIDGISSALGVNFLLAVCKELGERVEKLESK